MVLFGTRIDGRVHILFNTWVKGRAQHFASAHAKHEEGKEAVDRRRTYGHALTNN